MDVLIVDDNTRVRSSLARILERAGLVVDTAENGLAAYAEVQIHPYRVIVVDIQMPFMDGIEFYEELRVDYPDLARRVVFVTAWTGEPAIRTFLEDTGRPFLEKPFDVVDFVKVVRHIAAR